MSANIYFLVHVGGTAWRGAKFLPTIKFSCGQISPSIWGPPTLQNGIPRNGQKKLKKLWILWIGGETGILKDPNPIEKNPMKPFGPAAPAGTPTPPHRSLRLNGGGRWPGLMQPHGKGHASLPPRSMLAEHGHAKGSLAPLAARTQRSAAP